MHSCRRTAAYWSYSTSALRVPGSRANVLALAHAFEQAGLELPEWSAPVIGPVKGEQAIARIMGLTVEETRAMRQVGGMVRRGGGRMTAPWGRCSSHVGSP